MKLINLFLVIIILYVTYKIIIYNENFNDSSNNDSSNNEIIDLSKKNIYGKNVFYGVDPDELETYNKLEYLDLSKNNLIIDNTGDKEKFKINEKLCFGDNCINKEKIELISGKVDAPKFYKDKKEIYYNHDCNKSKSGNNQCKIKTVDDLPTKICFVNDNKEQCLEYKDLEVLDGERAMKLSNNYIKPNKYEGYVKEPYIYENEIECNTDQKPAIDYDDKMYKRKDWRKIANSVYKRKCDGTEFMNKCKQQCMNQQIRECKSSYLKEPEFNVHGKLGDTEEEIEEQINVKCADLTGSIKVDADKQYSEYDDRYCMTRKNIEKGNGTEDDAKKACNNNDSCTSFTYNTDGNGKKKKGKGDYELHNANVKTLRYGINKKRKCFVTYTPSDTPKEYLKYDNKYCMTSKNIGSWKSGSVDDAKNNCNRNPECTSFTMNTYNATYKLHSANAQSLNVGNNDNRACYKSFIPVDRTNKYVGYNDKKCSGTKIASTETGDIDDAIKMCDSVDNCHSFTKTNTGFQMYKGIKGFKDSQGDKCYRISDDETVTIPTPVNTRSVNNTNPENKYYKINKDKKCLITNKSKNNPWKKGDKNDAIEDCNEADCDSFTIDKNVGNYKLHKSSDITKLNKVISNNSDCYEKIYDVKESQEKEKVPTTSSAETIKQSINDNYVMPYYIDFKKTARGIGGTKDQLLYKTAKHCSQSDGINSEVPKCDDCYKKAYYAYVEDQRNKLIKRRKIRDYALLIIVPGIWYAAGAAAGAAAAATAGIGGLAAPYIYMVASMAAATITTVVTIAAKSAELAYKDNLSNSKTATKRRNKWILDWLDDLSYFAPRKYPFYNNINTEYRASSVCRDIKDKSGEVNNNKGIPSKCYDPGTTTISNKGRMCPNTCKLTRKDMFDLKNTKKSVSLRKKFSGNSCKLDFTPGIKCITSSSKMDNTKQHGFYILPYSEKTDPNYTGYFIDKNNYNITNRLNKNAINMAAVSKGTIDGHRASHNGECGDKSTKLASDLFFCTGLGLKNHFKTEHDSRCNPILYYDKKLKEKVECESKLKKENTFIKDIDDKEPDLSECVIDELDTSDDSNKNSISASFDSENIKETNYFIKPALNSDGNLIKPSTYFHGHEHVHMKDVNK